MMIKLFGALAASVLLAGCAVTPLPEQVVRYDTTAIVRYIRCEAANAVRSSLQRSSGASAAADSFTLSASDIKRAAIVYDFTFEIAGSEGGGVGLAALSTLTRGTLNIAVGTGGSISRALDRTFRLQDNFGELLNLDCTGKQHQSANWRYPIAGRIGLDEMIITFLDLYEQNNLVPSQPGSQPTMTNTLTFTTTVSVDVGIGVALNPLETRSLEVTKFGMGATGVSSTRIDKHKVIVSISMEPKSEKVARKAPDRPRSVKSKAHRDVGRRPATPATVAPAIMEPAPGGIVDRNDLDTPAANASRAIDEQKRLEAIRHGR